ncbi:hypothetical protein BO86DRAFT_375323 [Aspergillus japonicus CBS 114.51]|uniref:Uncharacterized protein n=1 Tax=Aspergillus japonicus CBS 114.51 TaxID=1448312 RepID=A0A8T8XFG7_ASPJA|nr:hypothetical protein BO86DRAFT_375323 [Aspergillus japonicus CBS 114.51]RAH86564.1 hypothetical protein BO86DRAFT_375323 [Aspergillus japonicus CBS 114.51]
MSLQESLVITALWWMPQDKALLSGKIGVMPRLNWWIFTRRSNIPSQLHQWLLLGSSVNNGLVYRPASNSVNCCHALLLNTLASSHLCHPRETNELALTIHWKSRFPTGFSISVSPNGRLARHSHQRHLRQPYPIKYNDRPIRFDSVEEADPMAEGQQASYLLGFFLASISVGPVALFVAAETPRLYSTARASDRIEWTGVIG